MSAEQTIDMTGHGSHPRYVEILTDAGIVRVNVNLEDTRTRQRCVVVEVQPNTPYARHTAAGGEWVTDIRDMGSRTNVVLIRQDIPAEAQS